MVAWGIISIYTGGVMKEFAKSAIFQSFWGHFHIVKLVRHKCQNQLANSNIKHPKPKYLLFLGVTYIHPCLKQLRYQKKLQVTHSTVYLKHHHLFVSISSVVIIKAKQSIIIGICKKSYLVGLYKTAQYIDPPPHQDNSHFFL